MLYRSNLTQDLTADQIDGNFRELRDAIDAMIASNVNVGIDDFDVTGDQFTVLMTDHTTRGPFTLPTAQANDRGTWQALTPYFVQDTFSINGTLYSVSFDHTSAASFDPGANDGLGHDYYHAMFTEPANSLPTGGSVGMRLKKSGSGDFITTWDWNYLDDLFDVNLTHPADGESLIFNAGTGKWENGLAGVADFTADAHKWVTGFSGGLPVQAQPDFTDLSGVALDAQIEANTTEDLGNSTGAVNINTIGTKLMNMTGNVTSIVINDLVWFNAGAKHEITITATNSGHTYADSMGTVWVGGTPPTVSNSFRITYWTLDGGSNVFGKYETFV